MSSAAVVLIIVALFCVAYVYFARRSKPAPSAAGDAPVDCSTCAGSDPRCEQVCMMEASTQPVEYFDDEELDDFRGRPSDSYSEAETAQFAEVLETLRPGEVKAWGRSIHLRGISLPDALKDEFAQLSEADPSSPTTGKA